jgi:hypothetical protein
MKTLSTLCAVLLVAALVAPADARRGRGGNDDHCTDAPRSEWQPISVVADKARAMGYDVQKTEISGTCYEVYGTKGGVLYELYFNPATAELVKTERE